MVLRFAVLLFNVLDFVYTAVFKCFLTIVLYLKTYRLQDIGYNMLDIGYPEYRILNSGYIYPGYWIFNFQNIGNLLLEILYL